MSLLVLHMDAFSIDGITLVKGNSLEYLKNIETASFDACITDPPYSLSGYDGKKDIGWLKSNKYWTEKKNFNITNEKWDKFSGNDYELFTKNWLQEIVRIVKPNGNILIFGSYHNIFTIGDLLDEMNLRIINSIVWYKRNAFPNITQRMLCESTEYIIWAANNDKKKAKKWTFNYELLKKMNNGKQMRNVWDIPSSFSKKEKQFGKHPTQKPEIIIDRLIKGFTNNHDKIIDPFMGAGTTPAMCLSNNRNCTGIEIEDKYYEIAVNRIKDMGKTKKISEWSNE